MPMSLTIRFAPLMAAQAAIAFDQRVGRAVVLQVGFPLALQFRNDTLGQYFTQLDTPLIERVDVPDRALGKDIVFVERDECPERMRGQLVDQNHVGRAIPLAHAKWRLEVWGTLRLQLVGRLPEGESFGLGEHIGHQQVVMLFRRAERLAEPDEVARDQFRALVNKLVERMLSVSARLAPDDWSGLHNRATAVQIDMLAVALHLQLLEVCRKAPQI